MLFYFFDVEKLIVRAAELDRAIFLLNIYLVSEIYIQYPHPRSQIHQRDNLSWPYWN